jgi:hypothetical protein
VNRRAFPPVAGAVLIAASLGVASAAPLPSRPGDSLLYRYDVAGVQTAGGQLWVVRTTPARVTITVSPAEDLPGTYAFTVAADGELQGTNAADADEGSVRGGLPSEMARSFAAAVNLLSTVPAQNAAPWNIDVPVPGTSTAMRLSARVGSVSGADRTVVADGSALLKVVPIAAVQPPTDRRGRPQPDPTPAAVDVTMHVEASLHGGILAGARGLTRMGLHGQTKVPAVQYTWTITESNSR